MVLFEVEFANPKGFYYPGETVAGHLTIKLDEEIEFQTLLLKYRGKSYCSWSTGSGDDKKRYHNSEEYISTKIVLQGVLPPDTEMKLGPGQVTYPFNFTLPQNIPPSFESHHGNGWVKYYMKIKFDSGKLLKFDIKQEIAFTVVSAPIDVNYTPQLMEPADGSVDKFLCCLCCKSGPIQLRCRINKQAFSPGEAIFLDIEVDNRATNTDLTQVNVIIEESVTFIASMGSRRYHHRDISLASVGSGIRAGEHETYKNVQLNIPADIASSFDNCKCVHLAYNCVVCVDIPSAIDSKVKFPITITHIVQATQPLAPPPVYMPNPSAPYSAPPPITMQPGTIPLQPPPGTMPLQPPPGTIPLQPPPAMMPHQPPPMKTDQQSWH